MQPTSPPTLMHGFASASKAPFPEASDQDKDTALGVCPETIYGWSFRFITLAFVVCAILTLGFVRPDMANDPIIKVYGHINVCILFDYSPAKEVFAIFWAVFVFAQTMYVVSFMHRLAVMCGRTSRIYRVGCVIGPAYLLTAAGLTLCLINPPSVSVVAHTVPYEVFIIGVCIWFAFNCAVIRAWPERLPEDGVRIYNYAAATFIILSVTKIYLQIVLMKSFLEAWDDETLHQFIPTWFPVSLVDPIWMVLLFFYRKWNPLAGKMVGICLIHIHETNDSPWAAIVPIEPARTEKARLAEPEQAAP